MYNQRSDDLFGFNIILQKRMQNKSNIRIISTENEYNVIKKTNMKKQKLSMLFLGILSVGMTLQSCDDDDNYYYYYPINRPNAIVTVKPETAESKFFLQLDDSTTLTPLNMNSSPYGSKEVRAMNACELTASITAVANLLASKLSDEELTLLGSVLTQLADTLFTISAYREKCER